MDCAGRIAAELGIGQRVAAATIALFDEGNTLPFIARYRKEQTGMLDEQQLRLLKKALDRLRAVEARRKTILASIEDQGRMTEALREKLLAANSLTELEDLYRPFKPRRRTRADLAREKGLQGLADLILKQPVTDTPLQAIAEPYVGDTAPSVEDALAGARDIVAQTISDHPDVRQLTRDRALRNSSLRSERREPADGSDPQGTYELYYEFKFKVDRLRPHQILAINRGEVEKVLRVSVLVPDRDWRAGIATAFRPVFGSPLDEQLVLATEDAAQRLLLPAIERDVRRNLTERAETHAIRIFANNLRALLNQPPLTGHTVLGIDPGYRTGCKVAVIDPSGKVLETATIYPHAPQSRWEEALKDLGRLVKRHNVTLIAIGNGTASRETEQLAAELIREIERVRYLMVDETGASVYSASQLARKELPDLDVTLRGAVSIARRVQDPLAELVKIDPRSLGVGMYQHDLNQTALEDALNEVVESVVNTVGVDLNTASPALLTHISGIGSALAERIVAYRDRCGAWASREAIKGVPGVGPKTYEQAAGFLRVRGGENPLDASAIHPESYEVAETLLGIAGLTSDSSPAERGKALISLLQAWPLETLAQELEVGVPTLADISKQLVRPGRDPRHDLPAPILRSDILKMEDVKPHLTLKGTVRNAVDFGCFIDIGVKNDGLLHRSQIPNDVALQVGDVIEVEILEVEPERGRISLGWPKTIASGD